MRLYDTLTRAPADLKPAHPDGTFRLYECGLTPSGDPHIGHARTAIVFDTLRRWLEFRGTRVIHVKNVTDVEDKIITKAKAEGVEPAAIVARYDAVRKDLFARMNLLPPTHEPYATKHIPEILDIIRRLDRNGLAYASGGTVWYRVRKFGNYGQLAHREVDDQLTGARIEPSADKEDPLDFALWKKEQPGEPAWDSPWGRGRPGWHIECSAMAMKYLGETFDLHGGATDLIFPHHENEIAQSEGATGKPFARIWAHPGFVTLNREKMSKSIGNVLPLKDVLDRCPAPALRLLVAQTHWRSPFEWSDDAERQAIETLNSLQRQLEPPSGPDSTGGGAPLPIEQEAFKRLAAFDDAMEDDLSTPKALAELFTLAKSYSKAKDGAAGPAIPALKKVREAVLARLAAIGVTVGAAPASIPANVQAVLDKRAAARKAKDWKASDALRDELKSLGWSVEDTARGQEARPR